MRSRVSIFSIAFFLLMAALVSTASVASAQDSTLEIKGPEEGSSYTLSEDKNTVVAYGSTDFFKPVKVYVDDEEIATANADGKGAWTYNLTFGKDDAGEHTLLIEDEQQNTTQVTFTVIWEESEETDEGDDSLPGSDPDVGQTGGQIGSCTSMGSTPTSTGLGLLSLLVGLAFIRREHA